MSVYLLVISDTHRIVKPIRYLLTLYNKKIKMAIHLGDHTDDLLRFAGEFPALEMCAVAGNCDYEIGVGIDSERILHINGKRILLTHGHHHNVKMGTDRLAYYAEEKEADACLFGHTHAPTAFEVGPIAFMNPGSLGRPRLGTPPAYGLLSVSDQGVIRTTLMTLS